MEAHGGDVVYPSVGQVVAVNRQMIESSGGRFSPPDNLINRSSLEYVLRAIAYPMAGQQLYPSLKEKAAALAYRIINRHVFSDGNKRTAVHIAFEFLSANGIGILLDFSIAYVARDVASGDLAEEDLLDWLHGHQLDDGQEP